MDNPYGALAKPGSFNYSHDGHNLPVAWDAGSLSRFPHDSARLQQPESGRTGDTLQLWSWAGSHCLRTTIRSAGPKAFHLLGNEPLFARTACMGVWPRFLDARAWLFRDAGRRARCFWGGARLFE